MHPGSSPRRKGLPMKKTASLIVTLAVVAAGLVMTPSASAKTIKLFVTPTYSFVEPCRPAPGQVSIRFKLGAKFKRVNSAYPNSVKIGYKVRSAAGQQIASGSVTLKKKSGWKKLGTPFVAETGTTISFVIKGEFRSPNTGRLIKGSTPKTFSIADDEQLIANGIPECGVG